MRSAEDVRLPRVEVEESAPGPHASSHGNGRTVTCAKAFLDLQLDFAEKVTILSGLPLARALLEYTNL